MVTKKKAYKGDEEVSDWVSQKEAADARGVELNVVNNWLSRGRLKHSKTQFGRRLVSLSEVLNYEPGQGGWPKGKSRKGKR